MYIYYTRYPNNLPRINKTQQINRKIRVNAKQKALFTKIDYLLKIQILEKSQNPQGKKPILLPNLKNSISNLKNF